MSTTTVTTSGGLATCRDSSIRVTTEDQVHEGTGVLLDHSEKLGLGLLELLHELVIEVRVLQDTLSDKSKVGVSSKSSEWVGTTGHTTTDGWVLFTLITVVISDIISSSGHLTKLVKWHAGGQNLIGDIRHALSGSQSKCALFLGSAGQHHKVVNCHFLLGSKCSLLSSGGLCLRLSGSLRYWWRVDCLGGSLDRCGLSLNGGLNLSRFSNGFGL